jgi:hypothetical protein
MDKLAEIIFGRGGTKPALPSLSVEEQKRLVGMFADEGSVREDVYSSLHDAKSAAERVVSGAEDTGARLEEANRLISWFRARKEIVARYGDAYARYEEVAKGERVQRDTLQRARVAIFEDVRGVFADPEAEIRLATLLYGKPLVEQAELLRLVVDAGESSLLGGFKGSAVEVNGFRDPARKSAQEGFERFKRAAAAFGDCATKMAEIQNGIAPELAVIDASTGFRFWREVYQRGAAAVAGIDIEPVVAARRDLVHDRISSWINKKLSSPVDAFVEAHHRGHEVPAGQSYETAQAWREESREIAKSVMGNLTLLQGLASQPGMQGILKKIQEDAVSDLRRASKPAPQAKPQAKDTKPRG